MIEGGLHPGAGPLAAPATPAAPAATRRSIATVRVGIVSGRSARTRATPAAPVLGVLGGIGGLVLVALLVGLGGELLLLTSRGLDLGLDLVAEVDLARLLLGVEFVPAAELAQFGCRNLELVRDPGIGAALAYPGADLVEL